MNQCYFIDHGRMLSCCLFGLQAVFRGDLARQSAKNRQVAVATVHRCMQTRHLRNR